MYSTGFFLYATPCLLYIPWPCRLHMVRLMLLERLLQTLPQLRNVGGVRAIPYMQVSSVLLIHYVTVELPSGNILLFQGPQRAGVKVTKVWHVA